ncbi:putative nuclease HARBI1 [Rhizophagus irregularis DAOM 181602=DAOM 197198]|nr:putative nuclease HARBI1 [Rhizophagus irregularis DAOM 181602=DAOM 197198]
MENEDLFEEEGDSSEEEEDDLVMLGLTSLLGIRYLEQRSYHVAKSKDCNHSQAPVELQLAIFLRRISSKEDIFGLCSRFGIAEETIYLYCKRVMIAIFSLKKTLVKWPTGEAKQNIHEGFKNIGEMEDVIGAIDGSHIVLANAPLKQPETYWNRKKRYSIQLQGIVDYRGMFIDYEIGWPGSVHDAKIYKNSYFYRNISKIIKGEEYLLGDSAYPISTFLIKPFVNSQNPSQIRFNVIHSLHRVVVENAFGRLKNRFIALKELNVRDISTVVKITECAIILHNFLELNNDNVEELYENDDDEDGDDDSDNDEDINQNEIVMKREGERKREQLMNLIINH